ncbi:MAG: EamA family transporter [Deltaproteobacteria bacterium]|nr:MAG: EamA family transporter [Deltaproteobacteria bacterium]
MQVRHTTGDWTRLMALVFIWGTSFLLNRIAVEGVPPTTVVAGRVVIAAIALRATVFAAGLALPPRGRIWLHFLVMALLGNAIPFFLITWGQERIDSGLAGILMAVMPLTTLVLAHFFVDGERMTGRRATGFAIGFVGLVVLMGPDALRALGGSASDVARQAAVLCGALCYAANTIVARKLPGTQPLVASAAVMLLASAAMVPAAVVVDAPWRLAPRPESVASVVWLGVVSTAAATILYFSVIASAGPTFLSLINYMIPLVAVLAGVAVLGEEPTGRALAALLLILAGVGLSQLVSQATATRLRD